MFFARESWQGPWTPDLQNPLDLCQALVNDLSLEAGSGVSLSLRQQQYAFELWFRTLFFEEIQDTKAILSLTGDPGSGKMTAARRFLVFLYGRKANVHWVKDEDGFLAGASHERVMVLDNVDKPRAWLANCPDKVATGQVLTMRKLWSTNEEVRFYPGVSWSSPASPSHSRRARSPTECSFSR